MNADVIIVGGRLAGSTLATVLARQGRKILVLEGETKFKERVPGEDGQSRSVTARLVVGADGRFSKMREWGGFTVKRDPDNLRIAGTIVHGTSVPDDGAHLCVGPGVATFVAPLGNKRARMYFIYI